MDKTNYAEAALGYNNRNKANFASKWFFWYLNPIFTKGAKDRGQKSHKVVFVNQNNHENDRYLIKSNDLSPI